jgi:hypothetical protein
LPWFQYAWTACLWQAAETFSHSHSLGQIHFVVPSHVPREQQEPPLSNWTVKYDEFAFLNQQLAGMLKSGIPLEPALRQMCASMRRGQFRTEFEALEADLSRGVPLETALASRQLPDFYKQMVRVGVKSNNLPAILTLLADYYQKAHVLWTRLKTLLIYPLIVLVLCFGLSCLLVVVAGPLSANLGTALGYPPFGGQGQPRPDDFPGGRLHALFLLGFVAGRRPGGAGGAALAQKCAVDCAGFQRSAFVPLLLGPGADAQTGCDLKSALALLATNGERDENGGGIGPLGKPPGRRCAQIRRPGRELQSGAAALFLAGGGAR